MHQLVVRQAYAYRDDPSVPLFDDGGPVVILDATCARCSAGARLISFFDGKHQFRFCPVRTPTGRAVLRHFGLDPEDPESWLYLADGRAYTSLDAIIRAGARVGGIGWLFQVFQVFPKPIQDWMYQRLARNRYRIFGHKDMCAVPDPALRARLID